MKHTAGPWTIQRGGDYFKIFSSDKSKCAIANTKGGYSLDFSEIEANAQLIGAAPELHEASEKLLSAMDQYFFFADGYKRGCASISEVKKALSDVDIETNTLRSVIHKAKSLTGTELEIKK